MSDAPKLDELLKLYYADPRQLAEFTPVDSAEMPRVYQELLAHEHHMTVTVENHHGCLVDVEVLSAGQAGEYYIRKIVLRRQSDGRVVLFGIVRLQLAAVSEGVRAEILSQRLPLGRILIQHNVWRQIHLCQLYKVICAPELAEIFGCAAGTTTYGRRAMISMDHQPALQLLEIVSPE
ncbi:MAG: hypothetical protein SFX18_01445 [Pirellulales bacterium]|nr:hypothetical protein [Pirellulales bacterium]